MHGLKGILSGVVADKRLNEKELLYLDAWLKSQEFLASDEDVKKILGQVGDILEDGIISEQELILMQDRIEAIVSHREVPATDKSGQIDELIGFLTGVAADGVLNDEEIKALDQWLQDNQDIRETWPASIVVQRLDTVLEDGIITDEERDDLLLTANQITGVTYEETTAVWEDKVDELPIADFVFCLTGEFVSGDRNTIDTLLKCLGAETSTSVNKSVDYLVIGTLASEDWLYGSHGRKIEKALLMRREDSSDIKIITERTLLKYTRTTVSH